MSHKPGIKGVQNVVQLHIYLDRQSHKDVQELAAAMDLSVNQYARRAVKSFNAAIRKRLESSESHQPEVEEQNEHQDADIRHVV